jgi:probable phosphoglycerate mutase
MQPLNAEANRLAAGFGSVTFEWIPRERNKHADRLANAAMDAQAGIDKPAADRAAPAGWTGAQGTPTRFLLLRHGQTPLTAERRYSGRGEVALSELGEQQAAAAAARLAKVPDIAAVVASPLTRTVQTGRAVADVLGVELTTHDDLIETDFGAWEGLTFREAAERDPELHRRWLSDTSVPPPDGESFDAVHRRVRRGRDDLVARYGGATIVVVSHVTPIKSLLRLALDAGPSLLYRLHLDTASLSIAEFYPDGNASVRLFNDTSHLG